MQRISSVEEMRAAVQSLRGQPAAAGNGKMHGARSIGLVPTMGALHEGHLSLVRAAKASCDAVVVSIFVNPTQFGPMEDFDIYPRRVEQDCALLASEGVDAVFVPSVEAMYPPGATTYVDVGKMGEKLDGASRPGHFRGVATVVSKLFQIVDPDRAYFGQKDAAQVAVLRRMVRDMHFRTELVACPIVREADGLAMSSRNSYLSADEREQALVLNKALRIIQNRFAEGERESERLIASGLFVMSYEPMVRIDYLKVVHPHTLEDLYRVDGSALVALAAFVGKTRLIDNVMLEETVEHGVVPGQA
ncbi:MAG: pantoate--beta-alanine ligase [Acidobacteriaceae bacterium]